MSDRPEEVPSGFENFPQELRDRDQWLMWSSAAEAPRRPLWRGNPNVSWNNPVDWHSFEEAVAAEGDREPWGIGYVFANSNDDHARGLYGALDLDGCVGEDGRPKEWLPSLQPFFDAGAYMEYSPSGEGIHIPVAGFEPPEWWSNEHFTDEEHEGAEAYGSKFFTVTGDQLRNSGDTVVDAGEWLIDWLAELYEAITGEDPRAEAVSEVQSGGKDDQNHSAGGSSRGNLGIYDVISRSEYPPGENAAHPFHPSGTGKNFKVMDGGDSWRCWRHDTGGYAIALVGQEAGLMDCSDNFANLSPDEQRDVYDAARERGYDVGESTSADGGTAATSAADGGPAGPDTDADESDDESDGWAEVRRLYATDENEESKRAMNMAAKLTAGSRERDFADGELDVRAHEESDALYAYDPDTGTYHERGANRVQEHLNRTDKLDMGFYPARARNVIETAKVRTYTPEAEFGAPEGRMCFANGVLDVSDPSDPSLGEHQPGYLFTSGHPVEHEPDADCPEFLDFLDASVRDEDREKLQEYAGYCLHTWGQPFKKMLMLVGPQNSGKGTFLRILEAVIGSSNISNETAEDLAESRWAAAQLHKGVANIRNEMSTAKLKQTERLKEMSGGGDRMSAESKHEQKFRFTVTQKFLFATNEVPEVEGDSAFNNRWLFASFPHTVPEPEIDTELADRIIENELSGVLNWMLDGYARLFENGQFSGERGLEAKEEMWEKFGSTVDRFKHACLDVTGDDDDLVRKEDLRPLYQAFCARIGKDAEKPGPFTKELTNSADIEHGDRTIPGDSSQSDCYIGITVDPNAFDSLDVVPFGPEASTTSGQLSDY